MVKVATWGTFDLLHDGHKEFLRQARELGDRLAVVVVPDRVAYENKKRFPLHSQDFRAAQLQALPYVNEVYVDSLADGLISMVNYKPEIFAFGYDQNRLLGEKLKYHLLEKGITPQYIVIDTGNRTHTTNLLKNMGRIT